LINIKIEKSWILDFALFSKIGKIGRRKLLKHSWNITYTYYNLPLGLIMWELPTVLKRELINTIMGG